MPARKDQQAKGETAIARARMAKGVTQRRLSEVTGVPESTLWRYERGRVERPKLPVLVNIGIALDVELEDLLEPRWRKWHTFDRRAAKPPEDGWEEV